MKDWTPVTARQGARGDPGGPPRHLGEKRPPQWGRQPALVAVGPDSFHEPSIARALANFRGNEFSEVGLGPAGINAA
eukprot:8434995-Pyramimonas_sp.AAC.1